MFRKLNVIAVAATLAAIGFVSTASADKLVYTVWGSNGQNPITHGWFYAGTLLTDSTSQAKDFVKLEPNVSDFWASFYEFKLNNLCDGVWDGWSPNFISAELGDVVHDYCPSSSMTTTRGRTHMGEK